MTYLMKLHHPEITKVDAILKSVDEDIKAMSIVEPIFTEDEEIIECDFQCSEDCLKTTTDKLDLEWTLRDGVDICRWCDSQLDAASSKIEDFEHRTL